MAAEGLEIDSMDRSKLGEKFTIQGATIQNVTYFVNQTGVATSTSVQDQKTASEKIQRPSSDSLSDENHRTNGFEIFSLEVECEALLNSSRHFQAIEHLKRLHEFQPNHIKTMMMLAECYFNLDKFDDCFAIAKEIRKTILKPPQPETRDLLIQADKCRQTKQRLTSLVLLWSCCSIFQAHHSSSSALAGISECVHKMDDINADIVNETTQEEDSKKLSNRLCCFFPLMMRDTELLIEEIQTTDKDLQTRVLLRCRGCQGDCFRDLHKNDEAIELYNRCIEQVEKQFGSNASKLYMYGEFLYNVGYCYAQKGDDQAYMMFLWKAQTALEICEPRSDDEMTRKRDILGWMDDVFKKIDTSKEDKIMTCVQDCHLEEDLLHLQAGDSQVLEPHNSAFQKGIISKVARLFRKRK